MTEKKLSRAHRYAAMRPKELKGPGVAAWVTADGSAVIRYLDEQVTLNEHEAIKLRDWLSATFEPSEGGE